MLRFFIRPQVSCISRSCGRTYAPQETIQENQETIAKRVEALEGKEAPSTGSSFANLSPPPVTSFQPVRRASELSAYTPLRSFGSLTKKGSWLVAGARRAPCQGPPPHRHLGYMSSVMVRLQYTSSIILSGIGHYGIMLIGYDDGKDLSEPVEGFSLKAAE